MDWKQFITELVSSIVWPAVAITVIFIFKRELANIVSRIAHLKYKDLELDFEKVKQQAEELHLEFTSETATIESPVLTSLEDQILDAAEKTPSAAILLAWSGLEAAIATAVSRLAISPDPPSYRSPMHNIDMLAKSGRLSKKHQSLLNEMRILRNKVAHEQSVMFSISQDQAMNYAKTAIELIKLINGYHR